jgi:hypothetical protein
MGASTSPGKVPSCGYKTPGVPLRWSVAVARHVTWLAVVPSLSEKSQGGGSDEPELLG